jgi:hypothetical protein
MDIVIILLSIGLVVLVVWMSASGKFSNGGSSAMGITAMHDMLPRDKQEAIEIMIEEKTGKKWEEQKSGEGGTDEGKGQKEQSNRTAHEQ